MHALLRLLALLGALVLAAPALAGEWSPDRTLGGDTLTTVLYPVAPQPTVYYLFDSTDGTGFSDTIEVEDCNRIDAVFFANLQLGGASTETAEVKLYQSTAPGGTAHSNADGLLQLCNDTDGDGLQDCSPTLDGDSPNRRAIRDFMAPGLVVEIAKAALAGETPGFAIRCGR